MLIPSTTITVDPSALISSQTPSPSSKAVLEPTLPSPATIETSSTTPLPTSTRVLTPQTDPLTSFTLPRAALLCVTVIPGVTIPFLLILFLYCRHRRRTASTLSSELTGNSSRSSKPLLLCRKLTSASRCKRDGAASRNGDEEDGVALTKTKSSKAPEIGKAVDSNTTTTVASQRRSSERGLSTKLQIRDKDAGFSGL
ncbi:hypothetical protein EX30DRAFT_342558 [Ascodesmis nigricans]|uniref:Uncharacterized protein n=1 Tax=Ascodesmis nigricans TaxID=341454 RepID=A0A4S2MPY2_9PEZI|nr:hypothetical protein EX30DRAFT_342558 [Ascodesmis nigricans]